MSFEFLQVDWKAADENKKWAQSKKIDNLGYHALFTQEMANIPETNIQLAYKQLNESIQDIKDNLDKAKVSDRIPAGVARDCPQGWWDDGAAVCWEPLTKHPCPSGWNEDGPLSCRANFYYDPCPPGTDRVGDYCQHPIFCKSWLDWGLLGRSCYEWGGGQWDHSPLKGGQAEPRKITGGRSVGKMNLPQHGGDLLSCPPGRPDYIDGLCYASCPPNRPYHLNGMPYLCVQGQDVGKMIKDEWDFGTIKKPQADLDIACAEAIRDNDKDKMVSNCGQNMNDYYKGFGEEIAANLIGIATMGVADVAQLITPSTFDTIFGHQPYGDADKGHVEGVISAMASMKWIGKQKACKKAIQDKSIANYLVYCELVAPELDPITNQAKPDSMVSILPSLPEVPEEDQLRQIALGINYDEKWIEEQIPKVPAIDESKIPDYPAWMTTQPSPADTPPTKRNMLKSQPPPDMTIPIAVALASLIFLLG